MPLLTIGHGTDRCERLRDRLTSAGVQRVVDVRRFPGSRSNPDVALDTLSVCLSAVAVDYRWEERLGGRRRLPPGDPVVDGWWTVAQFAAYAAHTRTAEFTAALDVVLAEAAEKTVALLCSEYVWWRCHRRLIADVAVLAHGVEVRHLMPGGRLTDHRPSAGAQLGDDGLLRWPG